MKKLVIFSLLFLCSCQLPEIQGKKFEADSSLNQLPKKKTAVIHLINDDISHNSVEHQRFSKKLERILSEKGYRFSPSADILLRLDYSSDFERNTSLRGTFEYPILADSFENMSPPLTSFYDKQAIYRKYITLSAVDAKNPKKQYWKTTVAHESSSSDFRQIEDHLLYLLSLFIHKDTKQKITGILSETEFYQAYYLNRKPSEIDFNLPASVLKREVYTRKLQAKINEHENIFKSCGLKNQQIISFSISDFGTLIDFPQMISISPNQISEHKQIRACVIDNLTPLLEPPVELNNRQPFTLMFP